MSRPTLQNLASQMTLQTPVSQAPLRSVVLGKIASSTEGHRICLYGTGGIGKTTLACSLPGPVAFVDLDESLTRLYARLQEMKLDGNVTEVSGITTWEQMRDALHAPGWDSVKSIVIDSATKAEELALAYVIQNKLTEKGKAATSISDYPYGGGYQLIYEQFLLLLGDLDAHVRKGRNVVLICHDCTTNVPNPTGADFLRYEPRLQSPTSGKSSNRLRVKEWADHLVFLDYDVAVKDGKAKGGSKTLYTQETPFCMAKSRTAPGVFQLPADGSDFWKMLIK